ncbi:hypothetical protein JHK82_035934 [Glycine max]|uniref:Uncharacterized protein n=2 Tax=Glycine subgen. Soja TaxID=1462606 RepID=A0A0R0GLN9_SOYBN|nr:hypothetical protein JHK87_035861 [Glycine soja]KAG4970244.1 hypothetical protein JHK85_036665 [Glycine max]KAG5112665.1 hypothetical protein JHK82_035934 [Glycine max]KAG5129944.1 hypothetical protein JHK84_036341 [Glycine max]KAH1100887.1 hypothetical protein GYH30_035831 [Glycine max]
MKFGGCSCLGTGSVGLGDTTILGGGGAYWFGCGRSRWRLVVERRWDWWWYLCRRWRFGRECGGYGGC